MSLRGRLFFKTFAGFWLATLAILGSWLLAARYFEATGFNNLPQQLSAASNRPPRFLLGLNYDLESIEADRLPDFVAEFERARDVKLWLLQRDGADLLGREPPAEAVALAEELRGRRRRAMTGNENATLFAHDIYNGEIGHFRIVVRVPHPRSRIMRALGPRPGLRLALAVLVSGLLCFVLSRVLTRRIGRLQLATRRLAEGELDTRIEVRSRGGDETDELARDFNHMATELQQRIQSQRRLLADVSHELRSPLARLRVALALAQQQRPEGDDQLARIERETGHLEALIRQLLASRAEHAELDTHIDLVPLLAELCADAEFEFAVRQTPVQFCPAVETAPVLTGGDLLHKAFGNILRNAALHSPESMPIEVSMERIGDTIVTRVIDRGPGVPGEQLERIFDDFYRVDSARDRQSGGVGLGLSIARRAVEQHGGRTEAANLDPGLSVTVTLPVDPDQ